MVLTVCFPHLPSLYASLQYLDQGRVKLREEKIQIIEKLLNIQTNGHAALKAVKTPPPRSSAGTHTPGAITGTKPEPVDSSSKKGVLEG